MLESTGNESTNGQYDPVQLEQDGSVSNLLNGTRQKKPRKNTKTKIKAQERKDPRKTWLLINEMSCRQHKRKLLLIEKSGI